MNYYLLLIISNDFLLDPVGEIKSLKLKDDLTSIGDFYKIPYQKHFKKLEKENEPVNKKEKDQLTKLKEKEKQPKTKKVKTK